MLDNPGLDGVDASVHGRQLGMEAFGPANWFIPYDNVEHLTGTRWPNTRLGMNFRHLPCSFSGPRGFGRADDADPARQDCVEQRLDERGVVGVDRRGQRVQRKTLWSTSSWYSRDYVQRAASPAGLPLEPARQGGTGPPSAELSWRDCSQMLLANSCPEVSRAESALELTDSQQEPPATEMISKY